MPEFGKAVPALMYHKIGQPPPSSRLKGTYVSRELFALQMRELAAKGFRSTGMADALVPPAAPNRKVVITFDDGFRNVLENALPALEAHQFKAIQFIVHDLMGATNRWDPHEPQEALMTKQEVQEWLRLGHEIGSHTLTHPDLTRISDAQLREEVVASKKALEDAFAVKIRHFCYPFGKFDARAIQAVEEAGYETACTIVFGYPTAATNRFEIPRLFVGHHRYCSQHPGVQMMRRAVKFALRRK